MSSAALADIIGRRNLDNLKKPTGQARGFPGVAYTSEELLRLENEKLFSRVWVHAGISHELANPGDTTLATVAGRPLILVCGSDRTIRAFYNSCPHRGTQVCKRNARKRKNFICPYHAWKFDIDGHLLETPISTAMEIIASGATRSRASACIPCAATSGTNGYSLISTARRRRSSIT